MVFDVKQSLFPPRMVAGGGQGQTLFVEGSGC